MTESEHIDQIIKDSLDCLYKKDAVLLNAAHHAQERCIAFRFSLYFYQKMQLSFSNYDIDCEYNKDKEELKQFSQNKSWAAPDLIVHKRCKDNQNLVVIEFKGFWAKEENKERDEKKIQEFVKRYNYKYGFCIIFYPNYAEIEFYNQEKSEPLHFKWPECLNKE